MSSPLLPEFDGEALRIILPATVTEINVESDLYSQWKEWVKISDNAKYPPAFRTVGGDPLTPGINAGAYFFIQNDVGWRIRPPEEDTTIFLEGNLAPEDSAIDIVVPTLGNFRVLILGLQPITQSVEDILLLQQDAAYDGVVSIDVVNGTAGTSFPIGTRSTPTNNIQDAFTIATNLGLRTFEFRGAITLDRDATDWSFKGLSSVDNDVVSLAGYDVDNTRFEGCQLTGAMSGVIEAINCELNIVLGLQGIFRDCGLEGALTLASGGTVLFDTCHSEVAGFSTPVVSAGSGVSEINFRNYSGGLELRDTIDTTIASVDLDPGSLIIHSSCIGGEIKVRGVGELTDNSVPGSPPGMIVNKEGLLDPRDVKLIKQTNAGNATVSLDDETVTIFDEDGTTVLATFDISSDQRVRTRTL